MKQCLWNTKTAQTLRPSIERSLSMRREEKGRLFGCMRAKRRRRDLLHAAHESRRRRRKHTQADKRAPIYLSVILALLSWSWCAYVFCLLSLNVWARLRGTFLSLQGLHSSVKFVFLCNNCRGIKVREVLYLCNGTAFPNSSHMALLKRQKSF